MNANGVSIAIVISGDMVEYKPAPPLSLFAHEGDFMNRKENIHNLLNEIALELLAFIKDSEPKFKEQDHWVPAAEIKGHLT